jgi:hypothetical protein
MPDTMLQTDVAEGYRQDHSANLDALAGALAKAQGEIEGAVKDKSNPAFRSKYADLGAVWDAVRDPLSKNGLAIVQFPRRTATGVAVKTMLLHTSGQWISGEMEVPCAKQDAHGVGSATTYARRFSLSAVVGVAPVDDDGNGAVQGTVGAASRAIEEARKDIEQQTGETRSTYQVNKDKKAREAAEALYKTAKTAIGLCGSRPELDEWFRDNREELEKKLPPAGYDAIVAAVDARRDDLPPM